MELLLFNYSYQKFFCFYKLFRNLKTSNLLISSNGDIKISDYFFFPLKREVIGSINNEVKQKNQQYKEEINNYKTRKFCYTSHEFLNDYENKKQRDIWDLGLLTLELLQGSSCYSKIKAKDNEIIDKEQNNSLFYYF